MEETAQVVGGVSRDDRIVIDQFVKRNGDRILMLGVVSVVRRPVHSGRNIIHVRHHPIRSIFRSDDPKVFRHPMEDVDASAHRIRACTRVLGIEVLIGRNITEDILITALRINAMRKQRLIVLHHVSEHEAVVQIPLGAAVPVIHQRDVPVFPVIFESSAREGGRRPEIVLLLYSEIRIPGRSIKVVIAILIVKPTRIAKFLASIKERFHARPPTSLWQREEVRQVSADRSLPSAIQKG